MHLALLLVLAQMQIVDIHDLASREHRVSVFVLPSEQEVTITATGAEPWPDRLRTRDDAHWQDDEQTTWPAAAWILDARTRAVVWDLRAVDTKRESNGLRHFSGNVRLPAGTYEAHYASYPSSSVTFNESSLDLSLKDLIRLGRRAKYGGPYVESGLYKQFGVTISGTGRPASPDDIAAAHAAATSTAIVTLAPERARTARKGFEITRPTPVEVYSIGELTADAAADYGWIMNADTRKRVWTMSYESTDPAGGAAKNRVAHETLKLKPGHYVAYFACDDSHSPDDWNSMPATDPESWGLTLRVADPAARASVRPFDYEPVPAGQTIVSLIGVEDDEMRSAGFALRRPMDVRIYAIGEGFSDHMADYAWIVDDEQHKRVWGMSYANTGHAGGAEKNRLFDSVIHLAPGNYLVYYKSDDSHSYDHWNGAPPAEERYWGISIFPATGKLNSADVGPFMTMHATDFTMAQLNHMGNDEDARTTFQLTEQTRVRVLAIGEGRDSEMFDYGWIEDAAGDVVWKMKYDDTQPAGGSDKNRSFDGVITLPAGSYVLRYTSDGSHSYGNWNANPPDDPERWGISLFRSAKP
ncbi:MAG: hypothetical protein DMD62_04650 [Gemmatimonadetes bacterium]|nr:MAG: hypothetical protein DMD62_04650 [Gemmatimonadota bacterium]